MESIESEIAAFDAFLLKALADVNVEAMTDEQLKGNIDWQFHIQMEDLRAKCQSILGCSPMLDAIETMQRMSGEISNIRDGTLLKSSWIASKPLFQRGIQFLRYLLGEILSGTSSEYIAPRALISVAIAESRSRGHSVTADGIKAAFTFIRYISPKDQEKNSLTVVDDIIQLMTFTIGPSVTSV